MVRKAINLDAGALRQLLGRVLVERGAPDPTASGPAERALACHRHGPASRAHVLAAQCDLETGRSLNIAPPGWQTTFDPLRDAFNHEHGWSRPDDPARARAQGRSSRAIGPTSRPSTLRAGLEHEADPRDLIRDYLVQRVEHGAVQSRADMVSALEDVGLQVPRQGKNYITARDPDSGKRWRLKGELYEQDFHPERLDLPAADPPWRPTGSRSRSRPRASWSGLARA